MNLRLLFLLFSVSIQCIAQSNDIIITEIFADPTPTKGLPEREFLEIYNTTGNDIKLKGFKLFYGTTFANFPDSVLKSNSYVIVCRKDYEKEFASYGKVIPLSNFSLANDGSLLVLKNGKDQDVFAVIYSQEWYSKDKDQGYSLEMIDLNFPCRGKDNWASSTAEKGATPGSINALNGSKPDVAGPKIINSSLDINQIKISFDENLSLNFLEEKNNFQVVNAENVIVSTSVNKYIKNEITIDLRDKLEEGNVLELLVKNIEDCSGNKSDDEVLKFFNLTPPDSGAIQISEILFNPKSGGVDFLEIYNNSEQIINLKNWSIANLDSKEKIANISELSSFDLLLIPNQYLAFTTDKTFLTKNYAFANEKNIIEIKKMPSFVDDAGTAFLFNPTLKEFDRFKYSEKMHNSILVNTEGVSLEKTKFTGIKQNENVWASASADRGFATPGNKNSAEETEVLKNEFYVEPIVFNPYQQNESMITKIFFNLIKNGEFVSIDVLDKNGQVKRHLKNNFLIGTVGEIEWDGKDDSSNILPVGYYVFKINLFSQKSNETFLLKTVIGSY